MDFGRPIIKNDYVIYIDKEKTKKGKYKTIGKLGYVVIDVLNNTTTIVNRQKLIHFDQPLFQNYKQMAIDNPTIKLMEKSI